MKVGDLIRELESYDKDAEVYFVKDWGQTDDNGCLTELAPLVGVSEQIEVMDTGLDFEDVHEVLLEFDMEG